jgi:molecular chaperone GrpE
VIEMNQENPNLEENLEPTSAEKEVEAQSELSLEEEIKNLKQLVSDSQDAFLRAKAEGENIRRRAIDDVSKAHKFAVESFAEELLPVVDSMYAAIAHHSEDAVKLREGVELTLKQLLNAFEKSRVQEINPENGTKFDPHHHQAISMVPSEQEANTVVTVLQRGFLIADRVLRPALVTVSQPK